MSLEYILLGMLRDPESGYDLRQAFDEGPRHFWSAELSQIYPTLNNMQKQGWLTSRRESSSRGPARRMYRRTRAGTRALHKWLRSQPDIGTERFAYIGQLVFHAELHDHACTRQFLEELRSTFTAMHQRLKASEIEMKSTHPKDFAEWRDDDFHELLCLRMGKRAYHARIKACDECLALLKKRGNRHGIATR